MNPFPDTIKSFLEECQIASVCFVNEEHAPHCINCFYAVDSEKATIIFKSSPGTYHHTLSKEGSSIAGTILPNEVNTLKIKGVQFNGIITANDVIKSAHFNAVYYKKYPFAMAMPGYIWAVELKQIKLTDNTLVFGKKEIWEREA